MNEDAERLEARLLGTDKLRPGALVAVGTQLPRKPKVFRVAHVSASGKVSCEGLPTVVPVGACRVLLPSEVRAYEAEQHRVQTRAEAAVDRRLQSFLRALARVPHNTEGR